jgi:hypothetical protein
MSHPSFRRRIAVVVLGMVLAAPLAMASEVPSRSESGTAPWNLFSQIWELFMSTWSKNGCSADPNGLCVNRQDGSYLAKNGCSADPDGHCGG